MVYERTGYAPWSLTREAGVQSATVDSQIQVPQYLQPIVDTGIIDEKGDWKGIKSSDEQFIGLSFAEAIPNGGEVLFPDTAEVPSINMRGFTDMFIALKPSNGGNYAITAVMGPDTTPFANLTPVAAARALRGGGFPAMSGDDMDNVLLDAAEDCQSDLWNIFIISQRVKGQQNMQFKIVNNSGGNSNIEFGFMRLI
jgi:hypothetical protein